MKAVVNAATWTRGLALLVVALLAVGLAVLAPVGAEGAQQEAKKPEITKRPKIRGEERVGELMRADDAEWTGDPAPVAIYTWVRCPASGGTCQAVAEGVNYTVAPADAGSRLVVVLTVINRVGQDDKASKPTEVIPAPAPPATPTPTPTPRPGTPLPAPTPAPTATPQPTPAPTPAPTPRPAGTPVPGPQLPQPPAGPPAVVPATVPVNAPPPTVDLAPETKGPTPAPAPAPTPAQRRRPVAPATPLRLLRPFPSVRVRGRILDRGARITLLTVRAPRGSRIDVRCSGRGCGERTETRRRTTQTVTRLRAFERYLRAGASLTVRVTKGGRYAGKHTLLTFRSGAAPKRLDRCAVSGSARPVRCPTS